MKQFKDLTLKGQKIRIVKDAISQIKIGKILPSMGDYFSVLEEWKTNDLQKELLGDNKCEACAKGSLFAACVINVDKVKISDPLNSNSFQVRKLKKWFPKNELDLIEAAFELEDIWYGKNDADLKKAIRFGKRFKSSKIDFLVFLTIF